jgi:hypothetical protein
VDSLAMKTDVIVYILIAVVVFLAAVAALGAIR